MTTRTHATASSTVQHTAVEDRRSLILGEVASALQAADRRVTDIESMIAAAGVSPQSITDEFGGTNGVVVALVDRLSASMLEPLGRCTSEAAFRDGLLAFAVRVTDEGAALQLRTLYRIAVTEAIRNTGLGRDFYRHGPGFLVSELAAFIDDAHEHGIVDSESSLSLAGHFMAILRPHLDLSDMFSSDGFNAIEPADRNLARDVALFCEGIRIGDKR